MAKPTNQQQNKQTRVKEGKKKTKRKFGTHIEETKKCSIRKSSMGKRRARKKRNENTHRKKKIKANFLMYTFQKHIIQHENKAKAISIR